MDHHITAVIFNIFPTTVFSSTGWRRSPEFRRRLIYLAAAQFYVVMMSCEFVFVFLFVFVFVFELPPPSLFFVDHTFRTFSFFRYWLMSWLFTSVPLKHQWMLALVLPFTRCLVNLSSLYLKITLFTFFVESVSLMNEYFLHFPEKWALLFSPTWAAR